eukprot:CAMPEP_0201873714 /NCGR_PEP_ID=MMETSP0902-20130614/6147_1 /ASSEMBLY_ACC=CAM_ASM_000551 /TAXON_ID=420261 /ORGANISM="Thalassiosira antarctica, Strain CCMP982" /LENGTH=266 /DNA_ID=CAMNT_0048400387 /DNA_START=66 /DNA_END=866 /DNA_ORIENTATION=+
MTTPHDISFRRALLLAYTALAAHQCHAFSSYPSSLTRPSDVGISSPQHLPLKMNVASSTKLGLFGQVTNDDEDHSCPSIVVIKTHEDYVKFLEEDDRLCVVKFYATWCKSCQKFGKKFRHLAFDEGDHINTEGSILHLSKVRFAQVEYSASTTLCKSLKVNKLPTVHMYRKGKGKIADMTCKPSLFHLVVDEMHRLLDDDSGVVEASPDIKLEVRESESNVESNGKNVTSTSFDELADEIMTSLRKKEGKEVEAKKEKNSWFPFIF